MSSAPPTPVALVGRLAPENSPPVPVLDLDAIDSDATESEPDLDERRGRSVRTESITEETEEEDEDDYDAVERQSDEEEEVRRERGTGAGTGSSRGVMEGQGMDMDMDIDVDVDVDDDEEDDRTVTDPDVDMDRDEDIEMEETVDAGKKEEIVMEPPVSVPRTPELVPARALMEEEKGDEKSPIPRLQTPKAPRSEPEALAQEFFEDNGLVPSPATVRIAPSRSSTPPRNLSPSPIPQSPVYAAFPTDDTENVRIHSASPSPTPPPPQTSIVPDFAHSRSPTPPTTTNTTIPSPSARNVDQQSPYSAFPLSHSPVPERIRSLSPAPSIAEAAPSATMPKLKAPRKKKLMAGSSTTAAPKKGIAKTTAPKKKKPTVVTIRENDIIGREDGIDEAGGSMMVDAVPPPKKRVPKKKAPAPVVNGTSAPPPPIKAKKPPKNAKGKKVEPVEVASGFAPNEEDIKDHERSMIEEEDEGAVTDDGQLYCICRKPDTGKWMIQCDACEEWFHGDCVDLKQDEEALIDKYFCRSCHHPPTSVTTWKRKCRLPTCRLPATIDQTPPSKYCTPEHGILFFKTLFHDKLPNPGLPPSISLPDDHHFPRPSSPASYQPPAHKLRSHLSPSDTAALVSSVRTYEQFQKLGNMIPTPPPESYSPSFPPNAEELAALARIASERTAITRKKRNMAAQRRYLSLALDRKKRVFEELKAEGEPVGKTEICGYDERFAMDEGGWEEWMIQAGLLVKGGAGGDGDGEEMEVDVELEGREGVCVKKRCLKHAKWQELVQDDLAAAEERAEERGRELDEEERRVRERRQRKGVKGGFDGWVDKDT